MYFTGVTGLVAGHPFDTVKVSEHHINEHHINKSVNFFLLFLPTMKSQILGILANEFFAK